MGILSQRWSPKKKKKSSLDRTTTTLVIDTETLEKAGIRADDGWYDEQFTVPKDEFWSQQPVYQQGAYDQTGSQPGMAPGGFDQTGSQPGMAPGGFDQTDAWLESELSGGSDEVVFNSGDRTDTWLENELGSGDGYQIDASPYDNSSISASPYNGPSHSASAYDGPGYSDYSPDASSRVSHSASAYDGLSRSDYSRGGSSSSASAYDGLSRSDYFRGGSSRSHSRGASARRASGGVFKKTLKVTGIIVAALVAIFIGWQALMYIIDVSGGSESRLEGVDVSSYQESINWEGLKEEGYVFAYIKATEGSTHVDPDFEKNWEEARDAGIKTGAYHFLSFETDGETQAENFTKIVPKESSFLGNKPLPPAIDVELYGEYEYAPPSQEKLDEVLKPVIEKLADTYGRTPVLYANPYVYEKYLAENYADYPIWISDADMPEALPDDKKWTFCQYTFKGSSPNVDDGMQDLDLNVFEGSRRDLHKLD